MAPSLRGSLLALFFVLTLASQAADLPVLGEVPDFKLVEASGQPFTRRDLAGRPWVAAFIFTRCAGVCPALTHNLASRQTELFAGSAVRLVSFSVDPERDTPAVLREYAAKFGADRRRWCFVTGDREAIRRLSRSGFKLGVEDGTPADDEPILHSASVVLVDRQGRIRGYYEGTTDEGTARLVADLHRLERVAGMPLSWLPPMNAGLNATAALLLVAGFVSIRRQRKIVHAACMLAAVVVSALFLTTYLTYHAHAGSTRFAGPAMIRHVYLAILVSHTVLAMVVALGLVPATLYRAARRQFSRHRALARWTLPAWLYVAVTGVVIYCMLYHW